MMVPVYPNQAGASGEARFGPGDFFQKTLALQCSWVYNRAIQREVEARVATWREDTVRMTRKDFVPIAAMLHNLRREADLDVGTLDAVTIELSDILAASNPRFDRMRFYQAAGAVTL